MTRSHAEWIARKHFPRAVVLAFSDVGRVVVLIPEADVRNGTLDAPQRLEDELGQNLPIHISLRVRLVGDEREAGDPQTSADELATLAYLWPEHVLANPVLDLLSLSDPAAWQAIVANARAAQDVRALRQSSGGSGRG